MHRENIYNKLPRHKFIHPFFFSEDEYEVHRNKKNIWEWYNQASIIYSPINKTSTYFPSFGDNICNIDENKIYIISNNKKLRILSRTKHNKNNSLKKSNRKL